MEIEKSTERITVEMTNGQFIFMLIILGFICALLLILVFLGEIMMAENRMEAVAQLFGKKLDKEFVIQDAYRYRMTAKFSEEGLLVYHIVGREWQNNHYWLNELLTGKAVIVDE